MAPLDKPRMYTSANRREVHTRETNLLDLPEVATCIFFIFLVICLVRHLVYW